MSLAEILSSSFLKLFRVGIRLPPEMFRMGTKVHE